MWDINADFLHHEADIVQPNWPEEIQWLYDNGLIKVEYDKDNLPHFSLTEMGTELAYEIDLN